MTDAKIQAQELKSQGQSYRQIAQALGISKSTAANYCKAGQTKAKFQITESTKVTPMQLNLPHLLPPGNTGKLGPIVPSYAQYSGVYKAGRDYYLPPDLAIRQSRENARNMWNNLVIRTALQNRLWSAAEQPWHIEPDDKKDTAQLELAKQIQKTIENIPNFLKLRYSLLKSRWFGVYGAQLVYEFGDDRKIFVKDWSELHGDSLVFSQYSDKVGVYVVSTMGVGVETEAGYIGRVHPFSYDHLEYDEHGEPYQVITTNERDAVIIMAYDPQASDFLDPRSAGGVKGLGIRSTVYPTWYMASEVLGNLMDWLERVGTGITIGKFIKNDEASYENTLQMIESQSNQAILMVPVTMDGPFAGKPLEGIERIEVPATGLENMLTVIEELFHNQIRTFIVGSNSQSENISTGLGSNIAGVQENVFKRIVTFDCIDLAETLTHQLVRVIQKWNHPNTPPCKFVIDFEKPDVEQQMAAIKTAYDMGVSFIEDEVRSLCAMTKPTTDDRIIKKSDDQPQLPFDQPRSSQDAIAQIAGAEQSGQPDDAAKESAANMGA